MHLIPLGRMAGMPSAGEASSGYLVDGEGFRAVLDAGPGTALVLSRHLPTRAPDVVFVSHEHTDHLWDLLPLGKMLLPRRVRRDGAELIVDPDVAPVPLLVPEGAGDRLRQLAALYPVATQPLLDRAFDVAFEVIEYVPGDTFEIAGATLRTALLRHVAPDTGIRIDTATGSLVYTGDTGVTDALPELAEGAGTLLSESTLRATDTTGHGHLSSADAARAARDAGVGELMLTHFSAVDAESLAWHVRQASEIFDGPVHIAEVDSLHPVRIAEKVRS